MGGWWRWALLSPDGVAHSRMVDVSACVNLPLHHKDQRFSFGIGSPGWSQKKGHKTVVVRLAEIMAERRNSDALHFHKNYKIIITAIIYTFVWHYTVVISEALGPGSVLMRVRREKRESLREEECL